MTAQADGNRIMLKSHIFEGQLVNHLGPVAKASGKESLSVYWLGQAGFLIEWNGLRLVIDPYLSESLEKKYSGSAYPHVRMMPAPIKAGDLGHVDAVLCTHHHTDHMDGETLNAIMARSPGAKLIVPRSARHGALERSGISDHRLILVDQGMSMPLFDDITLTALPAAHETIDLDSDGACRFLGYGIAAGQMRIIHSGDTIPFESQLELYRHFDPHLLLLPVNGRSNTLRDAGFAGNMTLMESVSLASALSVPMIAHHFGMFAFNTADPADIEKAALDSPIPVIAARLGLEFRLSLA